MKEENEWLVRFCTKGEGESGNEGNLMKRRW